MPGLWNHSPRGTAGRAVVGVEGASLAVLTANVLEGCAQRRRTRECVGRALLVSGDEKERRGGGCERRDRGHCWWLGDGGSGGARIGEGGAGHGEGEETSQHGVSMRDETAVRGVECNSPCAGGCE